MGKLKNKKQNSDKPVAIENRLQESGHISYYRTKSTLGGVFYCPVPRLRRMGDASGRIGF